MINKYTAKGTYFFDYGNAFLLEASRAGADIYAGSGEDFKYPSFVQELWGRFVLIMALDHLDGFVLLEKKKI